MSDPRAVFIAGAGTEIGKTYVTAALTRRLCALGHGVRTLKPLASGVPPLDAADFAQSDTGRLLAAQGLAVTPETVAACSPWRFAAPLSPDLAAEREGRALAFDDLVGWCRAEIAATPPDATLLIEGVGGVMSPVTGEATGLDWLKALRLPALLVSGSYLGAISHALTAAETLHAHGVPLLGLVVCASPDAPAPPGFVAAAIARHQAAPVVVIARDGDCPAALVALVRPPSAA
ncbi:ATP-dependent dethiobiotin synthetase BioD [Methylobacterium sp. Leaf104]|uniref:dethiobiotin synthase n=1 Tax=Methylobacterium TaxID=407 RepID=UPI0006F9F186|nr:dethiobiotin synthase [Methylobacterium sp. Leaf104]KQP38433.1 ATP-dependent dethiobiotin synthetase BioD [Methylobacterium sp. Leaf104]MCI9880154.1 dethiobiotin synthase [Methylobacterium goesingense]